MKLIIKDLIKIFLFAVCWLLAKAYCSENSYYRFSEALNYVPIHLIITIGYYAGISVCMKVINIQNCEKEHSELIEDIDEARKYYEEKKIKYN